MTEHHLKRMAIASSMSRTTSLCDKDGFTLQVAIFSNENGEYECLVTNGGELDISSANVIAKVINDVVIPLSESVNTIIDNQLKPTLPDTPERYNEMVNGMVNTVVEGLNPNILDAIDDMDNVKSLLANAYKSNDQEAINRILDSYNGKANS